MGGGGIPVGRPDGLGALAEVAGRVLRVGDEARGLPVLAAGPLPRRGRAAGRHGPLLVERRDAHVEGRRHDRAVAGRAEHLAEGQVALLARRVDPLVHGVARRPLRVARVAQYEVDGPALVRLPRPASAQPTGPAWAGPHTLGSARTWYWYMGCVRSYECTWPLMTRSTP